MVSQTTTIETVTIVRPLKIISALCLFVSFVLLIICLSTNYWLRTKSFHIGLFKECSDNDISAVMNPVAGAPGPGKCQGINRDASYITAVAVLLLIGLVATLIAFIGNILGLKSNDLHRKHVFYKIATYLALFTVLLELVSLIVFPVCFFLRMDNYGRRNWEFDWSYGIAWGSMLFTFGASLLLICDKEHEESGTNFPDSTSNQELSSFFAILAFSCIVTADSDFLGFCLSLEDTPNPFSSSLVAFFQRKTPI
uniref:Uncharacterized protein n=1 Tax=Panagrolaimus sp. JU765 TaxID=591449 RepID=A0AC34QDX0_9BILA